jgi:deoxyribodipyrimidine photo-lyase
MWSSAYFEDKLTDYAPASNWGNWAKCSWSRQRFQIKKRTFDLNKQIKILETVDTTSMILHLLHNYFIGLLVFFNKS